MNTLLATVITAVYLLQPSPERPPLMCYQPSHATDDRCAGVQQYLPPGYSRDDPNTWYRCWYSRQEC